ncbi:hypothetical protein M405DRAFT_61363 [Rhizopogon salebrosus TDB-379]|nr:hypothetical protein M405DRAFT_61363 [Rhizopogon salebrosus TDB-379]
MLEALQILKFTYKQDRLNFTEDLVADERDCTIFPDLWLPERFDELVAVGKLPELDELLANTREIDCN